MNNVEERADNAIRECLEQVPFVRIQPRKEKAGEQGKRPDLQYILRAGDAEYLILVEIKNSGHPKPVREAVNQVLRYTELYPESYGIIAAPFISASSASICTEAGVGYLDLAGNCYISIDQVFISSKGQENPFTTNRGLSSLYAPKASRVLRVLLSNPRDKVWKVKELSSESDVSLGHVSNVKGLLAEREWIRDYEIGFSLSEPEALLAEWSENYSFRKNRVRDFYSLQNTSDIESELAEACRRMNLKYALTAFSAAARYAPMVRYQRAMSYVTGSIEKLSQVLEIKEVGSGANISLLDPYDDGVLYGSNEIESIYVVSPIQAYLDLKGFRGRGEEAAKALLEQEIYPKWQ